MIENLSEDIWDYLLKEVNNNKLTLHEDSIFMNKLLLVEPRKFLEYNILNYPCYYLNDLFICIPCIWERVTFNDIKYLFRIVSEKEKFEGLSAMISFTSKYLKIDSVHFFRDIYLDNNSLRARFFQYGGEMRGLLYLTSIDLSLIDASNINLERFEKIGVNLIKESMGELGQIPNRKKDEVKKNIANWYKYLALTKGFRIIKSWF